MSFRRDILRLIRSNPESALRRLDRELSRTPHAIGLIALKARALTALSQYDDALYLWRDVIALGPMDADAHLQKATCLVELGAPDEALEELERALAIDESVRSQIDDTWVFEALRGRLL